MFMVRPDQQEAPASSTQGLPPSSFSHEAMPIDSRGQNPSADNQSPPFLPIPSVSAQRPYRSATLHDDLHYPAEQFYQTSHVGSTQAGRALQQAAHWDSGDFGYIDYEQHDGYIEEAGGYPDVISSQQDEYGGDEIGGSSEFLSQQAEDVM
ncbi:hypothetical protein GE09DRAFT_1232420 [Coniochaeta sp. 2T2.1]|nr:hypothetical protein GE09DRAFT_1232420 [Coniochaeta sp. 2T2.1]